MKRKESREGRRAEGGREGGEGGEGREKGEKEGRMEGGKEGRREDVQMHVHILLTSRSKNTSSKTVRPSILLPLLRSGQQPS